MSGVTGHMRQPVWFEREILTDLRSEVEERAVILEPRAGSSGRLEEACGAVVGVGRFDAEMMNHAHQLLVIARTGIGVDSVDVAEASRRGIVVCNAPDGPTISTAEHALALILAVCKQVPESQLRLRRHEPDLYARHSGIELDGATLGLVGYGRIARRLSVAARALGMKVSVFDPFLSDRSPDVALMETLEDLLGAADIVSLHLPLTASTAGSFGSEQFRQMRNGSVFINTARGGLVDLDALAMAVERGHLFGVGLDVTDPEPLPTDHPLLNRENVIVTPHVASATAAGKRRLFRTAFDQVIQVLEGARPPHLVNPDAWDLMTRRRNER